MSLIRKLLPGEDPGVEAAALERVVRDAVPDERVAVAISYPAGRDHAVGGSAYSIDADQPAIRLLLAAVRAVRPDAGNIGPCAGWSEAPFLAARGVPAIYFSPGDFVHCHTLEERVGLKAYADGVLALALFLASFGNAASDASPRTGPSA